MRYTSRIAGAFLAASLLGTAPAYAEYNILLNNIHRASEQNAQSRARAQGQSVARLATGFIEALVSIAPLSVGPRVTREQERAIDAVASTTLASFPEYVGTAIGGAWQRYAEEALTERGRADIAAREPELRARFTESRARRAAEVDYAARQRAIQERRARTYGPPRPNAFY